MGVSVRAHTHARVCGIVGLEKSRSEFEILSPLWIVIVLSQVS